MNDQRTILSTNAGELDTLMLARFDLSKVRMGCETMENMRVLRGGGAHRRSGFKYGGDLADQTRKARLEGFNFSADQGFVVEFSHLTIRIWQNGELVEDGGGVISITSPWTEDQVFALDFAQRNDGIVVTHGDVEIQLFERVSDTEWQIANYPWKNRVWERLNDDTISMTPSATTGVGITITSDTAVFLDTSWIGSRLRLVHVRDEIPVSVQADDEVSGIPTVNLATTSYAVGDKVKVTSTNPDEWWTCIATYTSGTDYTGSALPGDYPTFFRAGVVVIDSIDVRGDWSFETTGTWTGTYAIERSYDAGTTWSVVKTTVSNDDKNFLVEDTEDIDAGATFRVVIQKYNSSNNDGLTFVASSIDIGGVAEITGRTSDFIVTATVEVDFEDALTTTEWYEDAFSPKNGYAVCATFHQKRLVLGGSTARPQHVWMSKTRKPFDFLQGDLADDGLALEFDSDRFESVQWLVSHLSLLVGTTGSEWAVSSPDGLSVTPESNRVTPQTRHGSIPGIPARPLQDNVLFLQKKARKVRELRGGTIEYGGYRASDLTQLASHITQNGVTQITTTENPDSTLIMVAGTEIAILTYERSQNVVGWARWNLDGEIESVGSCNGAGEDDDIYVVVKRGSTRMVWFLTPDMLRVEEAAKISGDYTGFAFLDGYVEKIDAGGFVTMAGLDHFEGEDVTVFAEGEPIGIYTVTSGVVTLLVSVTQAIAGMPYTSDVRPMPDDSDTIGKKTSAHEVLVRFRNTLGAKVTQDGVNFTNGDFSRIPGTRVTDGSPMPLLTGDFTFTPSGSWSRTNSVTIRQDQPHPMTILGIRVRAKKSP